MPLFDSYIMVDWTGGNSRSSNRANCIWIAYGCATDQAPTCHSPRSRTEAIAFVTDQLTPLIRGNVGRRTLVCFDFAYAFPVGLAQHIPQLNGQDTDLPWRRVWKYLAANVKDDIDTQPGRVPTNRSNRFAVANTLNGLLSPPGTFGPFWCSHPPNIYPFIPQDCPAQPFVSSRNIPIHAFRICDRCVSSDTAFRLFGNGCVGSQLMVGIPRLHQLRYADSLRDASMVWPFETGWASPSGDWLPEATRIVHAEIYPSVIDPLEGTVRDRGQVKDRGQVRAMWTWARDTDRAGQLQARFAIPTGIQSSSADDHTIREEEGWILH
jgi:precorrin-8X/cobalt-precorrin-8 methylmutase